jgi:MFS transporter, SP family, arabinose:H+ symporter
MTSEAKAAEPERNVLADLDSRIPTTFYWYLAVLACIGGFLFGYDTSNIGSALGFIPYHLSSFAVGYLVAGASLGAAAGALVAGPLTDRFGRKILLVTDAGIYAVGAILSAVTVDAGMLLASRTLIGLAIGADSAIATAYIAEFAPRNRRGQLSIIQQWMITVGILVSYLVAVIILRSAPGSAGNADWRLILGLGGVPAIAAVVLRSHMPESPRWLMLHGRYDETRAAFGRLGMDVTDHEVRYAAAELARGEQQDRQKTQWTAGVRRALIVVAVFFIFQQITGVNVPFYYGPTLLSSFFESGHNAVSAAVAGVEVTAILGAVNVVTTYFAFRWIDKVGRRPLAMFGYAGMTVFILLAAAGVAFLTDLPKVVVVMVGFSFFITSFAIGVGGTGWLIQGEAFPTAVRGRAAAICACVDWLANYALIEAFPAWHNAIGLAWVMVCFAVLCVLAIGFVYRFLPETKGLSVEEAGRVFQSRRALCRRGGIQQVQRTGQERTDPPGGLVDEHLGIVAEDRVHGFLGDLPGGHLRNVESLGGIGIHVADIHSHDRGSLPAQADPQGVGQRPFRRLGSRVAREPVVGPPRSRGEHVHQHAASVRGQDRRERAGHSPAAEVVDLHLLARAVERACQQPRAGNDSGVVDDDARVGCRHRGRLDVLGVGDVKEQRFQSRLVEVLRPANPRVHPGGTAR